MKATEKLRHERRRADEAERENVRLRIELTELHTKIIRLEREKDAALKLTPFKRLDQFQ